jgi:hypothetical protein
VGAAAVTWDPAAETTATAPTVVSVLQMLAVTMAAAPAQATAAPATAAWATSATGISSTIATIAARRQHDRPHVTKRIFCGGVPIGLALAGVGCFHAVHERPL